MFKDFINELHISYQIWQLNRAKTREAQSYRAIQLSRLVKQRSGRVIAKMEREKGLV